MADDRNDKSSRLYDRGSGGMQESFSFPTDEEKYSINENITTLDELQTLSDLADQLQNSSSNESEYLTSILKESQTLLINGLTDNLDESNTSEAAYLIANIIRKDPYLEKIFLEYNNFSREDLAKIITAVIDAKADKWLKTQLTELHLRGSVSKGWIAEGGHKLLELKHKHKMTIDLDHDINLLLSDKDDETKKTAKSKCRNATAFFENDTADTPKTETAPTRKLKL